MPKLFIIPILLLACVTGFAQTRLLDSLKAELSRQSDRTQRLKTITAICDDQYSLSTDSLENYALQASELAGELGNKYAASLANHKLAFCMMKRGKADTALLIAETELKKNSVANRDTRDIYFKFSILQAQVSNSKANAAQTITTLYRILGEAELYNDTLATIQSTNGIASVRIQMDQPVEALATLMGTLKYGSNPHFEKAFASLYSNIAMAHNKLGHTDSALLYADKAIRLCRKIGNLTFLSNALSYQSNFFLKKNQLADAEASLREAIEVRKRMNDEATFQNDQVRLANFYLNTGQAAKAVVICEASLSSQLNDVAFLRLQVYDVLAKAYKSLGEDKLYQQTLERIISIKDTVQQDNASSALAEMQTRYEVQKKENTIIQQELDISRKNYLFYGSIGVLLFAVVLALLTFFNYRRREKLKLDLLLQKEKDSAALAVLRAGESERKRIAADLHDNLGAYAASIVSNLEFIQPQLQDEGSQVAMQELRHNSLSIVSQLNDTIWVLNKDSLSLTAISDRVKTFIRRVQPSFPQVQMQVSEDIEVDHLLPPAQAYQLFQIVQEAVNNALRHSGSRNVDILVASRDSWQVLVSDDGSGMDSPSGKSGGGNGLVNMKARAAEAGWNISWLPAGGKGTQVEVSPMTFASDR
ncbi:MAG: tetratricopeptide repeat protein [Chitinophagaceae bacterium]|nr:MAG: tetratricopeptide repeat protein [Chitinophagaceae bacterium]